MAGLWLFLLCELVLGANQAPPYDQAWCWEGRPCSSDSACKQPNGVNGACCGGLCRNYKLSRGELCGSSYQDPKCPSCDNNLNCVDSGNSVFKCQQQLISNGCLCNFTGAKNCISTQPCLTTGYCGPAQVLPGAACVDTTQCYQHSICNGTCQPVPTGQGCTVDLPLCGPGFVCLAGPKTCGLIAQLGDPCNADNDCAQPDLWCGSKSKCANRTALGGNCTGGDCVLGAVCNSNTCVLPRSVAPSASCSDSSGIACMSGFCAGGSCTPTHFKLAGQSCSAALDCPFGASCNKQVCTPSGLNMPCNPTLGGGEMDAQCQGSNDLYCSCDGICLPTDAAILPTGNVVSDCQAAKDLISNLKNILQLDISGLSQPQKQALATNQCCKNCNKGVRVSAVGFYVDCQTKTISPATVDQCGVFSPDPLALSNCPVQTTSGATSFGPFTSLLFIVPAFF